MKKPKPPQNVREVLERLPLTLQQLADLGEGAPSYETLQKWNSGVRGADPRADTLEAFATLLDNAGAQYKQAARDARRLARAKSAK